MSGALVVVGSLNADLVLEIDRLPKPGETVAAKSLENFAGGKGANQAATAAKLGRPTFLIGQIGSDSNGQFVMDRLATTGVNLSLVKQLDDPTGLAVVALQSSGENSIIIAGGANQSTWKLTPSEEHAICTAGAVLLQREIPEPINELVAKLASSANVPVVLDAGGVDSPISLSICPCLTVLSPNETELSRLTGMNITTDTDVETAARKLLSLGVQNVLVKLGARDSEKIRQPAIPVPIVVDTTGAGDCFTAAFVVGLLEGQSKSDALKFASIAASQCIQRKGAMSSLPTRDEVNLYFSS